MPNHYQIVETNHNQIVLLRTYSSGQSYKAINERTYKQFSSKYNCRVVIWDRGSFIWLATVLMNDIQWTI